MPRKKKNEEPAAEPKIVDSSLEEILADRFSRYSRYIIQERALPDARDGLKPVQRRILWAMQEDGNTSARPYRKSAKTVGNVIGNYHPHGDSSVYDAIVRMSQDWKSPLPLIDMQGNNGSIDDDPAAAMRYTEARLSRIADYLMEDIDKQTVDWAPNFSDEKMEPTVLPARFPNLLVHGVSGIAAGYATSIPPHNFDEVIDAACYRIDHPECSVADLMQFVKGPDFPTGGRIMGTEGIVQALETGKGRVTVRGKAEIEEGKTINRIVITEIPYEVVKGAMVRRMDELRLNGKISGLLDVRDESGRNGLRIVLDLRKEANANAILNYLYKNTDLQTYYHYNVIAIVNQAPRQLSLSAALDAFLNHRDQVVIKRSRFDLKKAKERAHIVEGLIRALDLLDEIIALIRRSKGKADARDRIAKEFSFSQAQAEAIVTLQLYRLSNTDIKDLLNENRKLKTKIRELTVLLEQPEKRKELIKTEMQALKNEFSQPRRTVIETQSGDVQIDLREMIPDETVYLAASKQGYLNRISLRSYSSSKGIAPGMKEGDTLLALEPVSTLDTVIVITDQGRAGSIPVYRLDEKKWKEVGTHYSSVFRTSDGEQICALFLAGKSSEGTDLIAATRKGFIRRMAAGDLPLPKTPGRLNTMMKVEGQDSLISVILSGNSEDELVLISKEGYGYQTRSSNIPKSGGKGRGVIAMTLSGEDELLGIGLADKEFLLLENTNGQFKKLALSEIEQRKRPAKGIRLYRQSKNSPVRLQDFMLLNPKDSFVLASSPSESFSLKNYTKQIPGGPWSHTGEVDPSDFFLNSLSTIKEGSRTIEKEEAAGDNAVQLSLEFDS